MVCDVLLITVLSTLTFSQILAEDGIVSSQLASNSDLNSKMSSAVDGDTLDEQLWNSKRASAFMPLRGRKDQFSDEKRASFMPLRGKKEHQDRELDELKRAAFMPMRGRRDYGDYDGYYYSYYYPAIYNPEFKRASFVPLRGKKDDASNDKRASFHALRGKKDVHYEMMNEHDGGRNVYGQQSNAWNGHEAQSMDEKRARSAFYGLRGKRSIQL